MIKKEYIEKKETIQNQIRNLQKEYEQLNADYAAEVMERNGYNIGQRITKNGKTGEIVGAEMFASRPMLTVNKLKKDGTVSQTRCLELSEYLKEI